MNYLLDTNVVSEGRKPRPDPNVVAWLTSVSSSDMFVSTMVIGELRRGVEMLHRRDLQRATALDQWLQELLNEYADRILPVTVEIAQEWGRMNVPDLLPAVDAILAATAKIHRMTLVTRDTGRLAQYGVTILNPFEPIR
ncbi:MAG TPA: type II toxin-antitoxin system VapC family toxin [Thermomicrobiales bacterium]|nr:type II toxin-antitoxin system VapC family toxin [Thermomicrobiales bacterium]